MSQSINNINGGEAKDLESLLRLVGEERLRGECREGCLAILKQDPHNSRARLLLARAYYLDGMLEFAVRELIEISRYSDVPSLRRLINAFGDVAKPFLVHREIERQAPHDGLEREAQCSAEDDKYGVVAEIDLDADFVDAIEELDKNKRSH